MSSTYWIGRACFVAFTVAILLVRRWLMRGAKPGEDACGHCGYLVRGLPSSICPECGSDITVVGTRRPSWWLNLLPAKRRNMTLVVWHLWWLGAISLLWFPYTWFFTKGTYFYGPTTGSGSTRHSDWILQTYGDHLWMARGTPSEIQASGGARSEIANWSFAASLQRGLRKRVNRQGLQFYVASVSPTDPNVRRFFVDVGRQRFAYDDPLSGKWTTGSGTHEAALAAWVAAMEQWLKDEHGVLASEVREQWSLTPPVPRFVGVPRTERWPRAAAYRSGAWVPDPAYVLGWWCFVVIGYVAGIVVITRRARRGTVAMQSE